ncbi:DciA family protein [Streptomyces prasinus]|uniref:DciA family protein n=1 Tax=Streptomyces prasinus TaxID=67345 RepID=UPI0036A4E4A5
MSEDLAPALSGVDLARVALQAARAAAKTRPADAAGGGAATRRVRPSRRTGGRDPITFAAAIDHLVAERAWEAPAAAGSVIDCWADIAPELVGKVKPVHYEPATRQLDLLPVSPAYATQLRLLGRQLIARINTKTGQETVKELRVLTPGNTASAPADTGADREGSSNAKAPVKTREMACDGYRRALAAHQAVRPDRHVDPAIQEAIESQTRALRELSRRAFPDPESGDQPSPIEAARVQRRRDAAAGRAAALRRAQAQRAQKADGQSAAVQPPAVQRTA